MLGTIFVGFFWDGDKSSAWYLLSCNMEFISFEKVGNWDGVFLDILLGALGYLGSQCLLTIKQLSEGASAFEKNYSPTNWNS